MENSLPIKRYIFIVPNIPRKVKIIPLPRSRFGVLAKIAENQGKNMAKSHFRFVGEPFMTANFLDADGYL
jgi:hypothetical protein